MTFIFSIDETVDVGGEPLINLSEERLRAFGLVAILVVNLIASSPREILNFWLFVQIIDWQRARLCKDLIASEAVAAR